MMTTGWRIVRVTAAALESTGASSGHAEVHFMPARARAYPLSVAAAAPTYAIAACRRSPRVSGSHRETQLPPVTTALLVSNVALFMLQSVLPGLVVPFALWPLGTASAGAAPSFMPWQIVTYAFLHGS